MTQPPKKSASYTDFDDDDPMFVKSGPSQKEMKLEWARNCRQAIQRNSAQEMKWCIQEAEELGIEDDHHDLIAVTKAFEFAQADDDQHPTRTELLAKEPLNFNRANEGSLASASMTGDTKKFERAVHLFVEQLQIKVGAIEKCSDKLNHHQQMRAVVEEVWKYADVDGSDTLDSTEAIEVVRILLSRPQLRETLGVPLQESVEEELSADEEQSLTSEDINMYAHENGSRTLAQLCKRSVSQAAFDVVRTLPQVSQLLWESLDADRDGAVHGEEFITHFEQAARRHVLSPLWMIAEERIWDIIRSDAWKEPKLEEVDRIAKAYRKREKQRIKDEKANMLLLNPDLMMEQRQCPGCAKGDCVIS